MSNYYLQNIILKDCPYGIATIELLKQNNIKNKIITVTDKNKYNYKTEKINTFPQIYLKRYNSKGSLLLGGYSDLNSFLNKFKFKEYSKKNVDEFIDENKYWSKKATLRLIELVNHK
jgi:hypothetical protein